METRLGRVTFIPKGAYDAEASYERLDLVEHEGSSYLCLKTCKGITPGTDDTCWMVMARRGAVAWAEMDEEEKGSLASFLIDNTYGFRPVLLTKDEFNELGDNIDPDTMYYVLEE